MATEKVRHVCNGEDGDLEQEDQKMEQFFALIRNFQEARNKRKHELRQKEAEKAEINKKKQNKMKRSDVDHDDEQSSWVPTFEWTDFTEEIEFRPPPIIFPSPYSNKQGKKKEADDDGLDLKLTL